MISSNNIHFHTKVSVGKCLVFVLQHFVDLFCENWIQILHQTIMEFPITFILLVHLLYLSINLNFQYDYHFIYFQYPEFLGTVTNFLKMMFPIFSHFVILFESFSKSMKTDKFINEVHEIKKKLLLEIKFPFKKYFFLFIKKFHIFDIVENHIWKFQITFVMKFTTRVISHTLHFMSI